MVENDVGNQGQRQLFVKVVVYVVCLGICGCNLPVVLDTVFGQRFGHQVAGKSGKAHTKS
jgi:hypothetical protein